MKKIIFAIVIVLISIQAAFASSITFQEAKHMASAFFMEKGKAIAETTQTRLRAMRSDNEEHLPYYIFNAADSEGFVIISDDGSLPVVLGYSDSGSLDEELLPEHHPLHRLLMQYARHKEFVENAGIKTYAPTFTDQQDSIAPLLTSKWGQHGHYNLFSPVVDGERCPTGCIATAFAQVMYYHKWPQAATTPMEGYTTYEKKIEMPALPSTTFEWDKMADSYEGNENTPEAEAVSRLMLYVGYAVEMNYTSMYSAAAIDHARKFVENFGYSKTTKLVRRSDYSSAKWNSLLYHELEEKRPVVYSAFSPSDGHGFVLDGYKDGLYHVSWGWYGACDGYYHIDILNTYDGEIRGDGFSCEQSAIIGFCPPQPDDEEDPLLDIYPSITPIEQSEYIRSSVDVDFEVKLYGAISSYRDEPFDVEVGWGLFQKDELVSILSSEEMSINGDTYWHGYLCNSEVRFGAGVTDGQYDIRQIYRYKGQSNFTHCLDTYRNYVRAYVNGDTLKLRVSAPKEISVVVDTVEYIGCLEKGRALELAIHLTNTSDVCAVPLYLWEEGESNRLSRVTAYVLPEESCIALMHMVPTEDCNIFLSTDWKGENKIWAGRVTLKQEEATDMTSIKQAPQSYDGLHIYDLTGKRVSPKGSLKPDIYIFDGKKVFLR